MAELVEQAAEFILRLVEAIGYPGIFLAALVETIFPTLPSEFVIPFSGFQVARGELTFAGAVLASTLGAVTGAVLLYFVGVWADEHIIRRILRRYGRFLGVTERDLDRALRVFRNYGPIVVFVGRLLPLVRTLISIPAGMGRMPLPSFVLFTLAGTGLWMAALTYAGVLLGENWLEVVRLINRYQVVLIVVVVVGLALTGLVVVIRRRRRDT